MSAASDYLEKKILDHVLTATTYTAPSAVYLALFTAGTLLEAGTLTDEVTEAAYARQEIEFDAADAVAGTSSNTNTETFAAAGSGGWGTITHVAIMDAATGGNVLFHGAVTTPKLIEENDIFQVTAGNMTITLA